MHATTYTIITFSETSIVSNGPFFKDFVFVIDVKSALAEYIYHVNLDPSFFSIYHFLLMNVFFQVNVQKALNSLKNQIHVLNINCWINKWVKGVRWILVYFAVLALSPDFIPNGPHALVTKFWRHKWVMFILIWEEVFDLIYYWFKLIIHERVAYYN